MQRNQLQKVIRQFHSMGWHAPGKSILGQLRMRQVVRRDAPAEYLAIWPHAPQTHAAEINAVITLLASNQ